MMGDMAHHVPDYGTETVAPPFRKRVRSTLTVVVLTIGVAVTIGLLAFEPVPPAAPDVAPGGPAATTTTGPAGR